MKKILLMAGHGNGDNGACCGAYKEAEEARAIVSILAKQLQPYGEISVFDTKKNPYHDYKSGRLPNFRTFDYVLEVHFNALQKDSGDGNTKGSEIFVTSSEKNTTVESLIVKSLARLGLRNRGVKVYDWAVIGQAKREGVSAALLEVCFLDDGDDMKIYLQSKQAVAQAICDGIVEGFGLQEKENWYDEAMKWAKDKGLMDGTRPYESVSRAELATVLMRQETQGDRRLG